MAKLRRDDKDRPATFDVRELYCPAHFGNAYEAMWPRELARYIEEVRYWGYNGYGDWLTAFDLGSPYAPGLYSSFAIELYDRKKSALLAAAKLGMRLDLIACPNLVYLDQLRPDLVAEKSPKMLGQLLCPSKPEARAIILDNFDRQFRDLAEHGVPLASWTAFAYDFGGCACDRCAPWILTFASLAREVRDVARGCFPAIETRVATWWWDDEEYRQFDAWLARHAPGLCDARVAHVRYGAARMEDGALPDGGRRLAFLHLGFGDVAGNGDIYAKFGAVVAPRRLPDTLANVAAQGASGFVAYSEGVFDDVNKAIAGALTSGRARDANEALREYAARYFGARGAMAERWARWLAAWGDRGTVDLDGARDELEGLAASATPGWRLDHLRSKLALEALDRSLTAGDGAWDEPRLAMADRFEEEQERLLRDVYRLGPVRAIFTPKIGPPAWYASWRAAMGDRTYRPFEVTSAATRMGPSS